MHIVAVGITYGAVDGLSPLGIGPVNDVTELSSAYAATLRDRGVEVDEYFMLEDSASGVDFNEFGNEPDGTEILNPHFPTKRNVVAKLRSLAESCGKGDLIVFLYSGHGSGDGSLCLIDDELVPHGSGAGAGFRLSSGAGSFLSPKELAGIFEKSRCAAVMIADSCHSGSLIIGGDAGPEAVFAGLREVPRLGVLAACGGLQTSNTFSGETIELEDGTMVFDNEPHGFLMGYVIPFFGLEHDGSRVFRTISAEEAGGKSAIEVHGDYSSPDRDELSVSECFASVRKSVGWLVGYCNEHIAGLHLAQSPEVVCVDADFIFYH